MSTQTFEPKPSPSANLVQIGSIEDVIQQRLAEERARLEKEAGLVKRDVHQFKKPRRTALHQGPTRPHHAALRRPDLEAREAGPRRAGRPGLPRRSRAHAQRQGVPDRQGIRQQRPVQPHLLHRRQPGAVPAKPGRTGTHASRRSSTGTSSSPPAPAVPAASACTRRNTAWRCATPGSTASACCCSSSRAASRRPTPKPAWR